MKFQVFSLLILLTLFSCGKKEGVVPVKLKLVDGSSAISVGDGGILLAGKSEDGQHSFRLGASSTSSEVVLELPTGKWEFVAISWNGDNGILTGDNRCAYSTALLEAAEESVVFNLSTSRCLTPFGGRPFSDSAHMKTSGAFLQFFPHMCFEGSLSVANCNPSSATNNSAFLSYRIIYEGDKKGEVFGATNPLVSACLPMNTPPRAQVPITDKNSDTPFGAKVFFYGLQGCQGTPVVMNFQDGFKNNLMPTFPYVLDYSANYYSYLLVNPGAIFNVTPINPAAGSFSLNSGGQTRFRHGSPIGYEIFGTLPADVSSMCVTLNENCAPGEWIAPLTSIGSYTVPAGIADEARFLKLFYKKPNGAISTTPAEIQVFVDNVAPIASTPTLTANPTELLVSFAVQSSDIDTKKVFLTLYDASCNNPINQFPYEVYGIPGNYSYAFEQVANNLVSSVSYCVKVSWEDEAGNVSYAGPITQVF